MRGEKGWKTEILDSNLKLFMEKKLFSYKNYLDLSKTSAYELFEQSIVLWDVIPFIKDFIIKLGKSLPTNEYEEVEENVWISKSATVFSSAYIGGPTIIQKDTQIRHCAFIRGSVLIGENCVVGNSTEIKNSILFNNVQVPHFNYVGDSILGYRTHLGAGAITSNVKSDKTEVTVLHEGQKINTGLKKFGAIIGDYSEVGCNAVLNPGTILGKNCTVYPTSMVKGAIKENTIFKNSGKIVEKIL